METQYPGTLIAVEGGDGAGKSTLCKSLTQELQDMGHEVVRTSDFTATPLGADVKSIFLNPEKEDIDPFVEGLLINAARRQHALNVIEPALKAGKIVIADRYTLSTIAYQGYARGGDAFNLYQVENMAVPASCKPHLTLYLNVEPTVGLERVSDRGMPFDKNELKGTEFQIRCRTGFAIELARREDMIEPVLSTLWGGDGKHSYVTAYEHIDAMAEPSKVLAQALTAVKVHLTGGKVSVGES